MALLDPVALQAAGVQAVSRSNALDEIRRLGTVRVMSQGRFYSFKVMLVRVFMSSHRAWSVCGVWMWTATEHF